MCWANDVGVGFEERRGPVSAPLPIWGGTRHVFHPNQAPARAGQAGMYEKRRPERPAIRGTLRGQKQGLCAGRQTGGAEQWPAVLPLRARWSPRPLRELGTGRGPSVWQRGG